MNRRQRDNHKADLLRQIRQQRLDLAGETRRWLEATAPCDRGWLAVMKLRKLLLVSSSVIALYNLRHPSRLIRWSRRALNAWGTVKLIRHTFLSR